MSSFTAADTFYRDYSSLLPEEREQFRQAAAMLLEAYERAGDPPAALSIQRVRGASDDVYEMMWGDNGRATFSISSESAGGSEPIIAWRRVGKVPSSAVRGSPLLAIRPVTVHQLPPDLADFTDRERTLEEAHKVFERPKDDFNTVAVLAITGKPGVGKSALAVHLAHRLKWRFPDGQLFVNLRDPELEQFQPGQVLAGFLRALDIEEPSIPTTLGERTALYRSQLSGRRILVLLDNARDEAQVRPLLPGTPTCGAIITSRRHLAGLEAAVPLNLDVLEPMVALEFLERMVGAERVGAEPEAAKTIVAACGYLPLAIRIAGMRLKARRRWSLKDLVERLAQERERLGELAIGDLEVRASFTITYDELRPPEARAFRLLGLLEGGDFGHEVVSALLDRGLTESRASLDHLADAQLLEAAPKGRYAFHDLLRAFARERLDAEESLPERESALARALSWYLEMASRARAALKFEVHSGGAALSYAQALEQLEDERTNLVTAVDQAARVGLDELAVQLATRLARFLELRLYLADWERVNRSALEAAERMHNRKGQAIILRKLGTLYRTQRRFGEAMDALRASLAIVKEEDDSHGQGLALDSLGRVYAEQRCYDEAIECFEESLAILREIGDRHGESLTLESLGIAYREQRRFDVATACFEESLAILREVGDRLHEGWVLHHLAILYRVEHRLEEAATTFKNSLVILREVGDRYGEAWDLNRLGVIYREQGRLDEAIDHHTRALLIFGEVGDRWGEGWALNHLATASGRKGSLDTAIAGHERALAIFEELGDRRSVASTMLMMSHVLRRQDEARARDLSRRACAILEELGALDSAEFSTLVEEEFRHPFNA